MTLSSPRVNSPLLNKKKLLKFTKANKSSIGSDFNVIHAKLTS